MIKIKDKIKSIFYRVLRSEQPNGFNMCNTCKKRRKNWQDFSFKPNNLIGHDNILGEWVSFSDYNGYAKIWVINGYITDIYILTEALYGSIRLLCRCCIATFLETYEE